MTSGFDNVLSYITHASMHTHPHIFPYMSGKSRQPKDMHSASCFEVVNRINNALNFEVVKCVNQNLFMATDLTGENCSFKQRGQL